MKIDTNKFKKANEKGPVKEFIFKTGGGYESREKTKSEIEWELRQEIMRKNFRIKLALCLGSFIAMCASYLYIFMYLT